MDMLTEMEMQVNPEYRVIKNTDGRRYSAYEQYEREGTAWESINGGGVNEQSV